MSKQAEKSKLSWRLVTKLGRKMKRQFDNNNKNGSCHFEAKNPDNKNVPSQKDIEPSAKIYFKDQQLGN